MASGTKGRVRLQEARLKADRLQESLRKKELDSNRTAIKQAVCDALNWSKLEPFAESMLDTALAGGIVDIKKLVADLEQWKIAQQTPPVKEESVTTEQPVVIESTAPATEESAQ